MTRTRFNSLFFPHDHKPEHFKALDGLRGIAVLIVILSHSSNSKFFLHEFLDFGRAGKTGVYLFFVLSAYLLDRQITLAFMNNKSSIAYWKNYFLRRFMRIYPLFFIALVLNGILSLFGYDTLIDGSADIFRHLLLLEGNGIFWSVPVEFKYYFISPIILWICHRFFKWNPVALWIMFIIMIASSILYRINVHPSNISTLRYFPIFLIGTIIAIHELLNKDLFKRKFAKTWFEALGFIAFASILISTPTYHQKLLGTRYNIQSPSLSLILSVLWGSILLAAKYGLGFIRRFLELKPLRFLGTISFSLYLFHVLILNLIKKMETGPEVSFIVFMLLAILFSSVSYLIIERPLSKIRIRSKN